MSLYHHKVGFPKQLVFQPIFGFTYSAHAREEAHRDYNGKIDRLPLNFLPRVDKVVEVETDEEEKPIKIVFRKRYDAINDLVIVLSVVTKTVKTVWLNSRFDNHFSLDTSRYDRPRSNA